MYIKAVTIHGFKSYKDPTTIELSQQCNVVVGRNGAGKSNFFAAIRFVLGDIFTNLRPEERQALLHEGAGLAVMSAYVEVVFDNSDNRFPIDREEVVLRRSIGLKKDEYFLDKKHVTKSDVGNLLESAGFSKSNPYYIVQQGKITSLTLMKDVDRLELLKEVAGCKVYDERRLESERIMKETESRRAKVVEVVSYIEDRLNELEGEKEELKEFQTLDREKRALEYTIYDQELKAARAKLQRLEDEKAELAELLTELHQRTSNRDSERNDLEAELRQVELEEEGLVKEKRDVTAGVKAVVASKTTIQLDMKDCKEQQKANVEKQANLERELKDVATQIQESETALKSIQPKFETELQKENSVKEELVDVERTLNELYSKQGRHERFSTKQERDKFLKKELAGMQESLGEQQKQLDSVGAEVAALGSDSDRADVTNKTEAMAQLRREVEECSSRYHEMKQERDDASNERKELWRGKNEIETKLKTCQEEVSKYDRTLNAAWGRDAQRGLTAVKQLVRQKKIPGKGIYGPLIELFEVDEKFITAVEVTAGGSLSHILVDSETTASKIVKELNRQKLGRVTFMPLQQMSPKPMEQSPGPASDVIPIISRLKFDSKFKPAFEQVFGKTLIARDTATASTYARQHKLNCITLEGDQVNKRGAITGGFNEVGKSRITAMKRLKAAQVAEEQLKDELVDRDNRLEELERRIADILAAMQRTKADERVKKQQLGTQKKEFEQEEKSWAKGAENAKAKKKLLDKLGTSVRSLEKDVASLETEIGTELVTELTVAQQQTLRESNQRKTELQEQLPALQQQRVELEQQKSELETRLGTNLKKRRSEIVEAIAEIGSESQTASSQAADQDSSAATLERLEADLSNVLEESSSLEARQANLEIQMASAGEQRAKLKGRIEKLKKAESAREQEGAQQKMDSLLSKRSMLVTKKETSMRKIRELGSLPADAFKYDDASNAQLLKKLKKNNEKLQKYAHVNKKALDQYINFTDQQSVLSERLVELDQGKEAIQKLITVLDQRKDEAIQRTFKGVSQHFTEVFRELVPTGKATLVMVKKKRKRTDDKTKEDGDDGDDVDEADAGPAAGGGSGAEAWSGVLIKVSFTGSGEVYLLNQLSGGQKSVVALAFIFAIQRLDPAPFYLFDEIDANLDAAHRTAVANLIQKFTKGGAAAMEEEDDEPGPGDSAQFICTTFRPELVTAADQCYGVYHRHKVSNINMIDADQAMQFITHETTAATTSAMPAQ